MNAFPERLRARRKELGLTQLQLAYQANTQPVSISQYENGEQEPHADTLVALSDALDCSTDYLIGKIDTPHHDRSYIENNPKLKEMAEGLQTMSETQKRSLFDFSNFLVSRA